MVGNRLMVAVALILSAQAVQAQQDPTGSWTSRGNDVICVSAGSASDGTYFYMYRNSGSSNVHRRFDPATGAWTSLATLPTQVSGNCGGYHDGFLYSFGAIPTPPPPGGVSPPQDPVYKYSIALNTWTMLIANLPGHGSYTSAAKIGTKFYLTGGNYSGFGWSSAVTEFDPVAETFTPRAAMPMTLNSHASAACNGKLYVFGGYNGSAYSPETYAYDPATDLWETKSQIPTARRVSVGFTFGNRCYIVGGTDSTGHLRETQEYTPSTDAWVRRADMALPRFWHFGAIVGAKGYVYGGGGSIAPDPVSNTSMEEFTPPDFGSAPAATTVAQRVTSTEIPQGATATNAIAFTATVSDPDAGQQVRLDVEVKHAAAPTWVGAVSLTSGLQDQGTLVVDYTIPALGGYDWRWRVVDTYNNSTAWTEFNDNVVSPDFISVAPVVPPPPPDDGGNGGGGGGCTAGSGAGELMPLLLAIAVLLIARR